MLSKKQVIVGKYYNGFIKEIYDISDFNFNTLRSLPFYYDKSTIYFSLVEGDKTKKTIFIKTVLPAVDFYNLICVSNPNPLSMEPIKFELKDLPESLHAININAFDPEYCYNLEIRTTSNFVEIEKAFLAYIEYMLPIIARENSIDIKSVFNLNPFDFKVFGKKSTDEILSFLTALNFKNPGLSDFISNYRMFILYEKLINSFESEEEPLINFELEEEPLRGV